MSASATKKAKADFESDNSVPYDSIVKAIEDAGYKVAGSADSGFPLKEILSLAAITVLYVLLQYTTGSPPHSLHGREWATARCF